MALFADFILDIFFILLSTALCRDWATQKNIINNVADLRSLYIEKDTVANLKVNKSESRNLITGSKYPRFINIKQRAKPEYMNHHVVVL